MNLVLTNQTMNPLPVMSKDEGGWCEELAPGISFTLSHTNSDVIIIGDKPDVSDVLKKTVKSVGKLLEKLKDKLDGDDPKPKSGQPEDLRVMIGNNGPNAVRVILGDGVTDEEVAPGVTYAATAPGYIEIRELGIAHEQGGTPD